MLFAFAGKDAWAYKGTWFNFRASLSKTGEGKVYGSFTSKEKAVNKEYENTPIRHRVDDKQSEFVDTYTPEDITLHLFAIAEDGWEFVEWQDSLDNKLPTSMPCDAQGIATNLSTKYGYATVPKFHSKNVCGENFSSSQGSAEDHVNQHNNKYKYNYYTRVDNKYKAVFRKLVKDPVVTAAPLDETLGEAAFSPGDNQVGDMVTIATHPKGPKEKGYENKFLGWQHNGEFLRDEAGNIIKENPYTFEVTEDNVGIYYAVYDSGYKFYRIKNYETKEYILATSDDVSGTGITAFKNALQNDFRLQQGDVMAYAGSVFEIDSYKNSDSSGRLVYDLIVQDKHTKEYYTLPSIYIRINQDADKNAWSFSTDENQDTRLNLRPTEDGKLSVSAIIEDNKWLWYIEPMDKDLETCENYFSLDPEKLVLVGDKYYTTLRTSWNILFNPEQMTPYVVTSVDETEGTFEMEPITGNIIPAGTPVIIKTKSKVIEENRMVPTKTAAANGAVPAVNLLKSSEKYFPNQTVATSANYKQLIVNANGELAFDGNALSKVNGNEAYLSVSSEVALKPEYKEVTLAQLVSSGKVGSKYRIKDGDIAAIVTVDQKQLIICKDDNKYANPDQKQETWYDYIHMQSVQNDLATSVPATYVPATYDQSNWIGLRLPKDQQIASTIVQQHQQLTDVRGVLTNKDNPELLLDGVPKANGMATQYSFNVYVAPNFYGENHQTGDNGAVYFFVQPKPMEPALVEWLIWDGNQFVTPPKASNGTNSWNQANLKGSFDVNFDYIESGEISSIEQLIANYGYRMPSAIVRLNTPSPNGNQAPRRAGETTKYVVYPLGIERNGSSINDDGVITDVARVVGQREVTSTEYYNVAGIRSDRPWQGVNIVVMRYSDGTTSASKMLR